MISYLRVLRSLGQYGKLTHDLPFLPWNSRHFMLIFFTLSKFRINFRVAHHHGTLSFPLLSAFLIRVAGASLSPSVLSSLSRYLCWVVMLMTKPYDLSLCVNLCRSTMSFVLCHDAFLLFLFSFCQGSAELFLSGYCFSFNRSRSLIIKGQM